MLGLAKHPWALGRPAHEVWAEIWDICGPLSDKVFHQGEASFVDDVRLFMRRGKLLEETFYSFSYSPIRDEAGHVGGLFCPSSDVTAKNLHARRISTLSELSSNALVEKSVQGACAATVATLRKNRDDIPFSLLYLIESDKAVLTPAIEWSLSPALGPTMVDLNGPLTGPWPLRDVFLASRLQVVPLENVEGLPPGPLGQPVREAVVLPVRFSGEERPVAILIAGVNPTRQLDTDYQAFYVLLADQLARALQNARSAEEQRRRAEALAELDQAKTRFFSNVSHEFRTPLTLMLGPVEELLSRGHTDLTPAAKSQLEIVNRNGMRLLRLVNTLLDFSRIEAGRVQARYEPTDLSGFTAELASCFRSATERAGLQLLVDCPPLGEPVYIDRDMWEKIVLNLVSNAFKFTFEGGITVSVREREDVAELVVRDTGVGIPAGDLPRLFERFYRAQDTRSRTYEGSGIGLALVQELVRLHGGSVCADSQPGKGTAFIVTVPLGMGHLPPEQIGRARTAAFTAIGAGPFVEEALRWLPESAQDEVPEELPQHYECLAVPCPPLEGESRSVRPRILLADDNADMRHYVTRLLSERYVVEAVPDGEAALAAVQHCRPDLVLSDVMMPRLGGIGLVEALRKDPGTNTIPVILLSARAGAEAQEEGLAQGADDYLIKPFSARELLARVQAHLKLARVRQEAQADRGRSPGLASVCPKNHPPRARSRGPKGKSLAVQRLQELPDRLARRTPPGRAY